MTNKNYYQVLGVSRDASSDEIRQAYKRLAREFHPDRNPDDSGAVERFKEVQAAYQVLGDEETRGQYDRFGSGFRQAGGGAGPGGQMPGGFDFSSLFGGGVDLGDLFGGRDPGRPAVRRGEDIKKTIQVSFQMAATGGGYDLEIGSAGSGKKQRQTVPIPAGIRDGEVLRVKGQGAAGSGGPSGDLLVTVQVATHPWFYREGDDLVLDVPLTPAECALGARIEVPTLVEGTLDVTVPAGTCSGARLRLKGKGLKNDRTGQQGNQVVVVKIVVPREVDEQQQEAYQRLADRDASPRKGMWQVP
ncbi:MAG: molecular chaperone DnaJ [Planctomycetaceae bacterium]|nr:molecular chaperone DnaJ [Planctomycetaceae bacterium]